MSKPEELCLASRPCQHADRSETIESIMQPSSAGKSHQHPAHGKSMQTGGSFVTRKVVQHRQTCGSLPRGQGTPSGTLQWPQHPQLVPVALQRPHPSLSADPRTHRQTRRLIKPHDKVDNYLDIYRGALAAAPRSGSGPQRSEKHVKRRPDTRPAELSHAGLLAANRGRRRFGTRSFHHQAHL
jgi:hypothetical protein